MRSSSEATLPSASPPVPESDPEPGWRSPSPIVLTYTAAPEDRRRIGEFVYALVDEVSDFALIRLDSGVKSKPRMCHFGGPTGLNRDLTPSPTVLHHYGNGLAIGWVLPARSALAPQMLDRESVTAYGAAYEIDSGSPVISDDGRAVGVLAALRVNGAIDGQGNLLITRLAPQISDAEDVLEIDLRLLKAPLD